jgi:toxin CcdB
MAQFDVYQSADGRTLLLDCQADLLDHLETRFVVPLLPSAGKPKMDRLHPVFEISGEHYLLAIPLASAVDRGELATKLVSLADHRYEILNGIDMLLSGY